MMSERYVILVPAYSAGGIQTYCSNYAYELYRQRKNVIVALWVDISSPYSVKDRGLFEGLPTMWVRFDGLDKASKVAKRLSQQMKLKNGDCLISQLLPWIGHIVLNERKTKDIFHIEILHDNIEQYYTLAKNVISTCDLYGTVNNQIAKKLRKLLSESGVEHIPVAVFSAGIEVPSTLSHISMHQPFRFCFIGRLCPKQKRIYDLIPLVKYLMELEVDFEFSILGGGNEEATLRQRFEEIGAQSRVCCLGPLPHKEVLSQLSKHHALVLTSAYEGGPVVICEAMAHGIVPVATRVGICEDVIRNGENGFLVDVGDVRTMANRLQEIATNPDLWSRMRHKAWETAREKLAISARVDTFLQAVEEARVAKINRAHVKVRRLKNRSVLDHPWIPNTLTRIVREKMWVLRRRRDNAVAKNIRKS